MMEPNPFTKQVKALPCEVRDIIVEKWLEGSKPFQIAQQLNLPRKTVTNIVDLYRTYMKRSARVGGNKLRTARTDRVALFTEFCKRQRPSKYAKSRKKSGKKSEKKSGKSRKKKSEKKSGDKSGKKSGEKSGKKILEREGLRKYSNSLAKMFTE